LKSKTGGGPGSAEVRFAGPWLIPDAEYLVFVRRLYAEARQRCLASLFLVGDAPWRDREFVMDGILLALAEARWRGVDARLLVGGAPSNPTMVQMADAARRRAGILRVPCRWLTDLPKLAGHAKVVISDDTIVVGSNNWMSGPAVPARTVAQDSVCVSSASLAARLERRFSEQWQAAAGVASLAS
jgi:phosphatidylserine/phosphatidylglycerophosphate/cardiolipin synthase-like enzyme